MAQLGARFHGMEKVVSSNLTRSTKFYCGVAVYRFGPCTLNAMTVGSTPINATKFEHF